MSWTIRIDQEQGVVYCALKGAAFREEISVGQNELRDNPDFKPYFRALYDLRGVTDFDLDAAALRQMSKSNPFDKSGRRAFVVDGKFVHGMIRVYNTYRDEEAGRIQIFDDMAKAKEWLDID